MRFRYGIEHECALLRAGGAFADFTNTSYAELAAIVDELPENPADRADLRLGDQGIKRKRWYVEGYERFDERGTLLRCDPKGLEIRTRIHGDVGGAVAARVDQERLEAVAARHRLGVIAIGFNPVRSAYRVEPPFNAWEQAHRLGSPEERTAHLHMTTYGPDLNLSWEGCTPAALVDAARKLTALSPYLVPLSFSSPFRDGRPWGGLSARTYVRTGVRPAVLAFLAEGVPQIPSDPSLTQLARLPAEVGRLEFKAFDACPDPLLYGELLSLLTGLVLDTTQPQRRTTPDAVEHRRSACRGYADPAIRAGADVALDAAAAAVADRPADAARLASLRGRFERAESPAATMLAHHAAGTPPPGLP
jgi:hypothetical protein